MPPRTRYYDPIVQDDTPAPQELPTLPALFLDRPGVYVNCDDVSIYLARLAERYTGEARAALLDAAQQFVSDSLGEVPAEPLTAAEEAERGVAAIPYEEPVPEEQLRLVGRIELYPNAEGKWETRACDDEGNIIDPYGPSDFDRSVAELNAGAKWPGVDIHQIADAADDSVWNEQRSMSGQGVGVHSGRPRISPRRMFVTSIERPEGARPVR